MISRQIGTLSLAVLTLVSLSCVASNDRYSLAPGNSQGTYTVKAEPNPMPPPTRYVPTTGPSPREDALQRRINQLETQQNSLQAEIERLKREKSPTP